MPVQHGFSKGGSTPLKTICGFVIEHDLIYIADASFLPLSLLDMIRVAAPLPSMLMVDRDGVGQVNSPHFSLKETYETALAIGTKADYARQDLA